MQKTYISNDNIAILVRDARRAYQDMLQTVIGGVDELIEAAPPHCTEQIDLLRIRERLSTMGGA